MTLSSESDPLTPILDQWLMEYRNRRQGRVTDEFASKSSLPGEYRLGKTFFEKQELHLQGNLGFIIIRNHWIDCADFSCSSAILPQRSDETTVRAVAPNIPTHKRL